MGALVLWFQPFAHEPVGSSASRTAHSFAYALAHHNFGRACSYIAQKQRGRDCDVGFTYNAGVPMLLGGVDIFAGTHVVAGSRVDNPDGSVTYKVASEEIPPTPIRIEQQDNGRWRVVEIG